MKHINVRLSDNDRALLEERAAREGCTVSQTVRQLLFDITNELQTSSTPNPWLRRRYHSNGQCTSRLDVKVPAMICEYLSFNGFNLTTCLLYQLHGN